MNLGGVWPWACLLFYREDVTPNKGNGQPTARSVGSHPPRCILRLRKEGRVCEESQGFSCCLDFVGKCKENLSACSLYKEQHVKAEVLGCFISGSQASVAFVAWDTLPSSHLCAWELDDKLLNILWGKELSQPHGGLCWLPRAETFSFCSKEHHPHLHGAINIRRQKNCVC